MDVHQQIAEAILARANYIVFSCSDAVAEAQDAIWWKDVIEKHIAALTRPSPFMKLLDGKN